MIAVHPQVASQLEFAVFPLVWHPNLNFRPPPPKLRALTFMSSRRLGTQGQATFRAWVAVLPDWRPRDLRDWKSGTWAGCIKLHTLLSSGCRTPIMFNASAWVCMGIKIHKGR